jgi:hypothetical protein
VTPIPGPSAAPPARTEAAPSWEDVQDRPRRRAAEEEEADIQDRPRRRRDAVAEEADLEDRPRRGAEDEGVEDRPRRGQPKTSGKAITSLVLGLLSLVCGCSFLTGLPALIFGFLAVGDVGRSGGRTKGKGLAITGIVTGCLGTLFWIPAGYFAYTRVQTAAARVTASNNLKQMGLAMHSYNDRYGNFPPPGYSMPPGQSNLSWRVALLPYLNEQGLYNQFHHNEPWDSPHNKTLLTRMPKVYAIPGRESDAASGQTVYQVFVGGGAVFEDKAARPRLIDITDGTSNTILIVEAANPVPWTKPDDLPFDPNRPLPALGGHFGDGFLAAFADGAVLWIPKSTPEKTVKAYITANGGEKVPPP